MWGASRLRHIFRANESGSSLVVVMIFSIIMLISAMAMMQLGVQDTCLAMRDATASQAFYNAEAGVERGEAWLMAQSTPPTAAVNPFSDTPEPFAGGLSSITIAPDHSTARTFYTVTSYATVDGRSRALEVDVTPTAFTDFLYYTNTDVGPGSPGYFRTGEVIDGPVHLNDEMAIWGNPTFLFEVESGHNTILFHNDWSPVSLETFSNPPYDVPDFQAGCELNVPEMPWLEQSHITILKNLADYSLASQDVVFGRDAGSGPMIGYVSFSKLGMNVWTDVLISSFNGIIYVNGDCNVSGIVDGQVTVCSNGIMNIVDDLLYADSDANGPRPGCDDLVGLVSGCKVNVSDNVPNGSDCVVHAHLIAVANQASLVEHYELGLPRGILTIYGGLAQDKWGPVGTGYYDVDGNFVVLTGYTRDFHYDWRLRTILPPGYDHIVFNQGDLERLAWREITPINLEGG